VLELRGGHGRRRRREEARGEARDPRIDRLELGRDGGLATYELAPPRKYVGADRQQLGRAGIAGTDRLDDENPSAEQERENDRARDDGALTLGQAPDHRRTGPGAGVGAAAGAVRGGSAARCSHAAWMRNCSRSRPRVTGEANSTRSNRGEFSRSGISALAALACPVSSTPLPSSDTSVSHASFGRSSVSSRRTGSGRIALALRPSMVLTRVRLPSSSRSMRSTPRTSLSRRAISPLTAVRR